MRWLVLPLWLLLWAGTAAAQSDEDRAAARQLGKEGVELYQAGNYAEAEDRLRRAHAIVGLTTTGLWRARCLVQLGRLVEASELYLEVTRMPLGDDALDVHRSAKDEARAEHAALAKDIPHVTIALGGDSDDVVVAIDGQTVPRALIGVRRPIDPGRHELSARRGSWQHTQAFEVQKGEARTLTVPAPAPEPQPDPLPATPPPDSAPEESSLMPLLGWIAVGTGVALTGTGIVFGVLAADKKSTLDDGCTDGDCPPPLHGVVDQFETFRSVSAITVIAGGVLLLGGVTLLVVDAAATDDVALRVGPGSASATWHF